MKCVSAFRFVAVLFLLTFLSANFQPASAQRYLTEFVGLSRVNVSRASVVLPSSLQFDELIAGRRLGGNFSYLERNGLGATEQELFSLNGVLETSGKCRVQLNALNNRGALSLFEKNFDIDIFALVGTISVEQDLGAISLSRSGFAGNSGFLRPVLSAIDIPGGGRDFVLKSSVTGESQTHRWNVAETGLNKSIVGVLERSGAVTFDIVASAGTDWLYVVGVGPSSFLTLKVAVTRTPSGALASAKGSYSIVDSRARTLDSGVAELSELLPE